MSSSPADSYSSWVVGKSNNGLVYVWHGGTAGGNAYTLFEYSADLQTILRTWDLSAEYAIQPIINGYLFTVYENANGDLILACDRGNAGFKNLGAFYLNDTSGSPPSTTATFVGSVDADELEPNLFIGTTAELGTSGYVLTAHGIISLVPPSGPVPLSQIVADISDETPMNGAYDVSELTDLVRWYAVAAQMTARNAISVLRPLFFFDAVESDDLIKFRKRGASPLDTIPDGDLCGRDDGTEPEDPLRTTRKEETELPRVVTLLYYDTEADYRIGAMSSPRQVTRSQSDVKLEAAIGLIGTEGLQKSWVIQAAEWIERETFEWSTTIKWGHLEPCDVVIVRGREIRILTAAETPNGVINWTGVLNAPSIYTQDQVVSGGNGFVPQPSSGLKAPTELILLDIPILSQHDAPFGFYAAMGPASNNGAWSGATLYKSLDGGNAYQVVASSSSPSIIGRTADSSGSPTISGVLGTYGGGDVVDESQLCVVLTDADAELSSITATALANGDGVVAISRGSGGSPCPSTFWELCQVRDRTFIAPRTYILKGFLRGRKGTSTSGHSVGDRIIFLPVTNVDAPEAEIGHCYKYKAVTAGLTLAETAAIDFVNTGLSAQEYYDTEIHHLPPFTGDGGSPGGGAPGLVPAPDPGDCAAGKYLDACGGWSVPPGSGGSGSPGGGGSMVQAQYLVMSPSAGLTDERTATGSANVTITESGSPGSITTWDLSTTGVAAGSYGGSGSIPTFTVDKYGRLATAGAVTAAPLGASYVTLGTDASLTAERVLTAGTNISITDGGANGAVTVACTLSAGGNEQAAEYTTPGTYSFDWGNYPNCNLIHVTMIAGGGGGSSRNAAANGGGGGGSGELVVDFPVPRPTGSPSTVTVVVGAAGVGATGAGANVVGGNGGNSTFGAFSVLGGNGGTTGGAGGAGGGSQAGAGGAAGNPGAVGSLGTAESTCHFGGSGGSGGGTTTASAGGAGRAGPGFSTGTAGGVAAGSQAGGGSGAGTLYGQGGAGGAGGAVGSAPASTAYGAGGGGAGGKATTGVNGGNGAGGYVLIAFIG